MIRELLLAALVAGAPAAAAKDETREADLGGDRFMAGPSLRIAQPVAGDLIAIGGDLDQAAPVAGDAVLAGGSVEIRSRVAQDVYAAGGDVRIEGAVGRNVRMAGGNAEVGTSGQVGGNLAVAGGDVAIRGPVTGHVQAAGGEVLIDAAVGGDVHVAAGDVVLGPNARIAGKLVYRSSEALRQDPAAQVAGGIERGASWRAHWHGERERIERGVEGGGWLWTVGLIALAALLAGAFPAASRNVAAELRARPGFALLAGFIVLVCVPFAAVVLMITLVGLPVALVVLLLYFALLLVGYASAAVTLGDVALARLRSGDAARTAWRIGAAMAAMLLLALVGRIPYLGGLVVFLALIAGIGAIVMAMRPERPPPAAA